MDKKLLIPVSVFTLVVALAGITLNTASAQEQGSNYLPPFAQGLIERFNLNENDVQSYFEEQRDQRHEQMRLTMEERLGEYVSNGSLTEDQKNAWLQRMEEHHEEMEQNRGEHRAEFEAWAQENGIDSSLLQEIHQFGHGGMRGRMHK